MARPFHGSVVLDDGTRWEARDYLAVAAGTIAQVGLNFKPFHRYDERPGIFHILGIHTSPLGFVHDLPRIHRAEPMRPGKTYDALCRRAIVRAAGDRMRYMIDGDLHEGPREIEVTIGPQVKLVVVR